MEDDCLESRGLFAPVSFPADSSFRNLPGRGRGQSFSNVNMTMTNVRVRQAITTVPAQDFGKFCLLLMIVIKKAAVAVDARVRAFLDDSLDGIDDQSAGAGLGAFRGKGDHNLPLYRPALGDGGNADVGAGAEVSPSRSRRAPTW